MSRNSTVLDLQVSSESICQVVLTYVIYESFITINISVRPCTCFCIGHFNNLHGISALLIISVRDLLEEMFREKYVSVDFRYIYGLKVSAVKNCEDSSDRFSGPLPPNRNKVSTGTKVTKLSLQLELLL